MARVRGLAPQFEADAVVNEKFERIKLQKYNGKYVVLLFYPLDFTFVCPTEIVAFSDRLSEFHDVKAEVLAISVDSKFSHLAWASTPRNAGGLKGIRMPLVSDLSRKIATDYGVLITDPKDGDVGVALRGLFIIDDKGIIRHKYVNDLPVGRNVDEVLRLVKAFQYVEKHGEVCPAGWKPGQATMVADPVKSKKYFATAHAPSSPEAKRRKTTQS